MNFDIFHAEVLALYVPFRVMERLKLDRVFRPQLLDESLSQYVGDIRTVWRVLRLDTTEQQLVDIVLQGLKPEERSRLVFAPRPSSLADLDRLSILSRSIQDADSQRSQAMGRVSQADSLPIVTSVGQDLELHQRRRPPITCFGCGQRGHIRRDCRQGVSSGSQPKN